MNPAREFLSKRKIILALTIAALGILVLFVFLKRSSDQDVLQKFKAELRAKGEKLSLSDLPPPISTNGNPNLTKLTNAVNQLHSTGFDPKEITAMRFLAPGKARVSWTEEEFVDYRGGTNQWENLSKSLTDNIVALQDIREAVEFPEADIGWLRTNVFDRPKVYVQRRTAAQWLAAATLNALHEDRIPDSLKNLHALFRLAQMHEDDLNLVNQMIRVATTGLALATTWETLQSANLNEPQLSQIQADLMSFNLVEAIEKGFIGDRIYGVETFQIIVGARENVLGQTKSKPSFLGTLLRFTSKRDELSYLQITQRQLDHFRLINSKPWAEVGSLLKSDVDEQKKNNTSFREYLYPVSTIIVHDVQKACQKAVETETQRQMALAAVALKRHELRHDKPALNLASLVPEFLSEMPRDLMDRQPIKYHLNGNSFVLYSVGHNGRDESGNPQPERALGKKEYDLWDGLDAVWPIAEIITATPGSTK